MLTQRSQLQQHTEKLEGAIKGVGSSVQDAKSAILIAFQEGTVATADVLTAVQIVAKCQETSTEATTAQLQTITMLSSKVEELNEEVKNVDRKAEAVPSNVVSAMGLEASAQRKTMQDMTRKLQQTMNAFVPLPTWSCSPDHGLACQIPSLGLPDM